MDVETKSNLHLKDPSELQKFQFEISSASKKDVTLKKTVEKLRQIGSFQIPSRQSILHFICRH